MNRRALWWLALAALPLLVLGLRWSSFPPSVIDWDESLYLLQAREWRRGVWPLSGVWDMHPVGAPAMIAIAFTLLGESLLTVRLLGSAVVAATGYALIALVRVAGGPRALGYAAALLYAGHTVLLGGLATNTEILFAPMVVAALVLALRPGPAWPRLVGMGLLVGCALVVKPVATPEGCLAFALLAWPVLRAGQWRRLLAMAGAYLALCLTPSALVAATYAVQGEFGAWLDSTILAPFQYASESVPGDVVRLRITHALAAMQWLWLLPLPALLLLPWLEAALRRLTWLGLLWLLATVPAVAAPGYFFDHYFLILMPPLALLSATGAFALARLVVPARAALAAGLLASVVAAAPFALDLQARLARGGEFWHPDPPYRVAAAIRAEMRRGDVVFVVNYQPVLYFLTPSPLPTRFPFPAHLTGAFGNLAGVDMDAEVARVLATRPRFIVLDRYHWFTVRPAAGALVSAALAEHYRPMANPPGGIGPIEIHVLRESD